MLTLDIRSALRISGHFQIIEDHSSRAAEFPHFLGHVRSTLAFDESDSKPSQSGNVFRAEALRDSATVLIEVPVEDVVTAVFDAPVLAVVFEDLFCCCLLGIFTGDSVGDHTGILCIFPVSYSFNFEGLGNMGKVQAVIEFGGHPYASGLLSPMVRLVFCCMVLIPVNIFEK